MSLPISGGPAVIWWDVFDISAVITPLLLQPSIGN